MIKQLQILLFLLICFSIRSSGQSTQIFEQITSENGTLQSIVYCVAQDSFGNIWAGTEEGVIRYNSREFYLYDHHEGLPEDLTNRVSSLLIDSKSRIWIGTPEGLLCYNSKKDEFESVKTIDEENPSIVEVITEDEEGNIWIGGFNGLWKTEARKKGIVLKKQVDLERVESLFFDNKKLLVGSFGGFFVYDFKTGLKYQKFENSNLREVYSIFKLKNQYIVGTRNQGLFKTDENCQNIEQISLPVFNEKKFPVKEIITDKDGNLVIATDGAGILKTDEDFQILEHFINDADIPGSVSSNGIYDLLLGSENMLWVATYGGGLNKMNLTTNWFQNIAHRINDPNSINHNFTRSILEDREGNIWFGTKKGVSILNAQTGNWRHIPRLSSDEGNPEIVMALEEDGDHIWAGTYGSGAFKINKKTFLRTPFSVASAGVSSINLQRIYSVLKDNEANIWFGGIGEDVLRLSPKGVVQSFPVSQIRQIIKDGDGRVLTVGRSGVHRIVKDNLAELEIFKPGQEKNSYATVTSIHRDQQGNLTVGTNGGGVLFYNSKNGFLKRLTQKDGLPSDIVQGVLYDDYGKLWASTTRGVAGISMTPRDTLITVFKKGDGLASTEFNYGSFSNLSDGRLAFGGVGGVTIFRPSEITRQSDVPKVIFEKLDLFKEDETTRRKGFQNLNSNEEVTLKYSENTLGVKFVGVMQSNPSGVRYSWKMEGVNDQWSTPSSENSLNFSNLDHGSYVLKVRAANRDGIWGKEQQLKIKITPPWWKTWWAYLIYALLVVGALIGGFYLAQVILNQQNAREQIAFFYNITHELKTPLTILLSSLEKASESDDADKAQASGAIKSTVTRLNSLFDQLLNFNKVASGHYQAQKVRKIALAAHLKKIAASFEPLLKKRDISLDIRNEREGGIFYFDKRAFDKILFNLISNAVKYSQDGGRIEVILKKSGSTGLKIEVVDNGIGIPQDQQKFILKRYYRGRNAINSQTPGTGLGLMIVKNLVEKDNGSISFSSTENVGTTFTVELKDQFKNYKEEPEKPKEIILVPPETEAQTAEKISEFSDSKILVVEDNDELRNILVEKLSTHFQVFEAINGQQGLEIAKQQFPDLILTDFIMPEMDGMALSRALQEDINLNHIPIIMMTVLNSSETRIESAESGIAVYLEKPINFKFLYAKIIATLTRQRKLRQRFLHQTETETAGKFRNERDAEFINNLEKFVIEKVREESLSVHDLCREVGMSRTALYMKLKNMVDLSPQNFIITTRLKYARKLLTEGGGNIKEVAYNAGFSNPKYFSTSFKKLFGKSPTSYLKSLKE